MPAAFRDVIRWSAPRSADDEAARLEGWPATLRLHVRGLGDVLFCHATPRSDVEIFTRLTAEERLFEAFEASTPRWSSAATRTCRSIARCAASGW